MRIRMGFPISVRNGTGTENFKDWTGVGLIFSGMKLVLKQNLIFINIYSF